MLIIEKMETALDTIREAGLKSSLSEHSAVVAVSDKKEALVGQMTSLKTKLMDAIPFATEEQITKLDKKVTSLNRKMNQLKKQLKELDS